MQTPFVWPSLKTQTVIASFGSSLTPILSPKDEACSKTPKTNLWLDNPEMTEPVK